jgi:hypothetical protein
LTEENGEETEKYLGKMHNISPYINNYMQHHISTLMYDKSMRTTITLNEETHAFASYYARVRGLTLSAAIDELIRKGEAAPPPEPEIAYSEDGFPMFPPSGNGRMVTNEMVKNLEEKEFDPQKFA